MKIAKLPPIAQNTKLLCFDLESNGLHGQAFAVGAVVMDMQGNIKDKFTARIKVHGPVDEWVEKNVIPAISNMPITHASYKDMCNDFWRWFVKAQSTSDYVVVSNGYPVEYKFLLDCQQLDLDKRYWQHPFPIIDLSSLLLGLGQHPKESKKALTTTMTKDESLLSHNPLHDAKITALRAIGALRLAK